MALLTVEDTKQLAYWYRDEITFLLEMGEAVASGDRLRCAMILNQRREKVGAKINELAKAVGIDPIK